MSTDDFITALFIRVDTMMADVPKYSAAYLYFREVVTLGLLFALKDVGTRVFYRWLYNNYRAWFPTLLERTRLFGLFAAQGDWSEIFFAQPTTLGVINSYGIELRHPWREDRVDPPIGCKGLSNNRCIVGAKLTYVVNQYGLIMAWNYAAANVADNTFQPLIAEFQDEMIIRTDTGVYAKTGDPASMYAAVPT